MGGKRHPNPYRALIAVAGLAFAATAPPAAAEEPAGWTGSASLSAYLVPEDDDYLQPTLAGDRGRLHLELRYAYEGLDTASAFIGCNLAAGESPSLEVTPLLGVVFGDTRGIAPGYRAAFSWRQIELYSEGEYVFDLDSAADRFFYAWSEATLAPTEWLRFGLVAQRTRVYQTPLDIQRGLLLGLSWRRMSATVSVFDPDQDQSTVVLAFGCELGAR